MNLRDFEFGNPKVNAAGFSCCGKPVGCTIKSEGCAYLHHPWKRAHVFGDPTVRCQATCLRPHPDSGVVVGMQCSLKHGHEGECVPEPIRVREMIATATCPTT